MADDKPHISPINLGAAQSTMEALVGIEQQRANRAGRAINTSKNINLREPKTEGDRETLIVHVKPDKSGATMPPKTIEKGESEALDLLMGYAKDDAKRAGRCIEEHMEGHTKDGKTVVVEVDITACPPQKTLPKAKPKHTLPKGHGPIA